MRLTSVSSLLNPSRILITYKGHARTAETGQIWYGLPQQLVAFKVPEQPSARWLVLEQLGSSSKCCRLLRGAEIALSRIKQAQEQTNMKHVQRWDYMFLLGHRYCPVELVWLGYFERVEILETLIDYSFPIEKTILQGCLSVEGLCWSLWQTGLGPVITPTRCSVYCTSDQLVLVLRKQLCCELRSVTSASIRL